MSQSRTDLNFRGHRTGRVHPTNSQNRSSESWASGQNPTDSHWHHERRPALAKVTRRPTQEAFVTGAIVPADQIKTSSDLRMSHGRRGSKTPAADNCRGGGSSDRNRRALNSPECDGRETSGVSQPPLSILIRLIKEST